MAKPLSERVAAALASSARLADVRTLIVEVEAAGAAAAACADQAKKRSLDPELTAADARQARLEYEDHDHEIRRHERWRKQLEERRDDILADERFAKRRAEYEAAAAERDALATEIAERYPKIAAELLDLVDRIEASDRRCATVNGEGTPRGMPFLVSAEAIARGSIKNFYWPMHRGGGPVMRLRAIAMPKLNEDGLIRQPDLRWD